MSAPEQAVVLVDPDEHHGGTGTARFVLKKLVEAVVSILLVVVLFFFLFRMLPGDPVATMVRERPTDPRKARFAPQNKSQDDQSLALARCALIGRYVICVDRPRTLRHDNVHASRVTTSHTD